MTDIPTDLGYIATHQWTRRENNETVAVGITDFAQDSLGDIVYVDLPEVGSTVTANQVAGIVESVKTASDVYSPVSGTVVAINQALEDDPEIINSEPYTDGWFFKVKLSNPAELDALLNAQAYGQVCEDED
jgi:glycine cleavage system H protein